jgi:hypothetical protein
MFFAKLGGGLDRAGNIEIEDRDTRTLSGERLCCREANTARTGGSGNDCSFTRQKHIPSEKTLFGLARNMIEAVQCENGRNLH